MSKNNTGFWIKDNQIINIDPDSHIHYIYDNPDLFNISQKFIKEIYNEYNEVLFKEDKARLVIFKKIMKDNSWIRIRYFKYRNCWIVTCWNFSNLVKSINHFFLYAYNHWNYNCPVRIYDLMNDSVIEYKVEKGVLINKGGFVLS